MTYEANEIQRRTKLGDAIHSLRQERAKSVYKMIAATTGMLIAPTIAAVGAATDNRDLLFWSSISTLAEIGIFSHRYFDFMLGHYYLASGKTQEMRQKESVLNEIVSKTE